jgi:hypothetical protein
MKMFHGFGSLFGSEAGRNHENSALLRSTISQSPTN